MPTALENTIDALSDPAVSLPDALRRLLVVSRLMKHVTFRQPVAELDALSLSNVDPQLPLPLAWLARYRRLAEERKVPLNAHGSTITIGDNATVATGQATAVRSPGRSVPTAIGRPELPAVFSIEAPPPASRWVRDWCR